MLIAGSNHMPAGREIALLSKADDVITALRCDK
jgi:hypothetical protein